MEATLAGVVIVILAAWLAATVALQLPRTRRWLQERDVCALLPEYRFFAPRPAEGDLHLLFRDTYADGTVGRWTEICRLKPLRLSHALWNPDKRERKALFDCVVLLLRLRPPQPRALAVTTPYLLLLNHVSSFHRTARPTY